MRFLQSTEHLSFQLYEAAGQLSVVLLFMFIFCFIGHLVTEKSLAMADSAYETIWYGLPVKHQAYVKLIIQFSHEPFVLSGWGLIDCNLENYSGVMAFHP